MTTPRTEAGRSFRAACGSDHTDRILAIEAEARQQVVDQIRERLNRRRWESHIDGEWVNDVLREAHRGD